MKAIIPFWLFAADKSSLPFVVFLSKPTSDSSFLFTEPIFASLVTFYLMLFFSRLLPFQFPLAEKDLTKISLSFSFWEHKHSDTFSSARKYLLLPLARLFILSSHSSPFSFKHNLFIWASSLQILSSLVNSPRIFNLYLFYYILKTVL